MYDHSLFKRRNLVLEDETIDENELAPASVSGLTSLTAGRIEYPLLRITEIPDILYRLGGQNLMDEFYRLHEDPTDPRVLADLQEKSLM
jgi:hypothetical protein